MFPLAAPLNFGSARKALASLKRKADKSEQVDDEDVDKGGAVRKLRFRSVSVAIPWVPAPRKYTAALNLLPGSSVAHLPQCHYGDVFDDGHAAVVKQGIGTNIFKVFGRVCEPPCPHWFLDDFLPLSDMNPQDIWEHLSVVSFPCELYPEVLGVGVTHELQALRAGRTTPDGKEIFRVADYVVSVLESMPKHEVLTGDFVWAAEICQRLQAWNVWLEEIPLCVKEAIRDIALNGRISDEPATADVLHPDVARKVLCIFLGHHIGGRVADAVYCCDPGIYKDLDPPLLIGYRVPRQIPPEKGGFSVCFCASHGFALLESRDLYWAPE